MAKTQTDIISELEVKQDVDPAQEIHNRKEFMKNYLEKTKTKGFVLGISGGQDSTLLGKLAQDAIHELNQVSAMQRTFIAVRLPYGEQVDEDDAQEALRFIKPDKTITVNIKKAVDSAEEAFQEAIGHEMSDFNKGNTKARERMKVQYDLAAEYGALVLGTDHAAEAISGFFTKFGDGACDIAPLFGLNKRQGKALLRVLDAPAFIYEKVPTADLESDKPALADEKALGMTYEQIDDFLEGKEVPASIHSKIIERYEMTEHKRQLPVTPQEEWWTEL
ncbi:ammonia-dependent NAD(+) synthetase [Salsuginibacillus kocurii]|uniref:ammonia-dependent NAD(+) synthetase n=1 Tax=Salsuginibacillus kocurii TaxID=427078 RepID=UPI0003813AE1|nr:ammonia-dependent NAD(+) synthetase [Salsuginibacillus kocurii]